MPLDDEIARKLPSNDWSERFLAYIDQTPGAKERWAGLLWGGNPFVLMQLAALATAREPTIEKLRERRKAFSNTIKSAIPKINEIAEVANDLNTRATSLALDLSEFARLPERLREYALFLENAAALIAKHSSKRLPTTNDYMLYFLHLYILKATGKVQWLGMATLLEAASSGNGTEVELDEENIRKRISGLAARDARTCSQLEHDVDKYLAEGNGNWFSPSELEQIVQRARLSLLHGSDPETNLPK